jgi:hypothetical protein
MEQKERDFLARQYNTVCELEHEFFLFKENTKVQLLSNQLQYFQSLAGIALAIIAILFGTKLIHFSICWLLAAITALLLIIYVSTNVRESNDRLDKSLNNDQLSLTQKRKEVEDIIFSAIDQNDLSIFHSYINRSFEVEDSETSYSGEIAIFLFLLMIFWCMLAFIFHEFSVPYYLAILLTAIGIFFCFIFSMFDWNLKMTEFMSRYLHVYLKK